MKILHKINLLIVISVLSLLALSLVSNKFKNEELKYYSLVESIKTLNNHVLNALIYAEKSEKDFSQGELVHQELDKGTTILSKIAADFQESDIKTEEIKLLLGDFKDSFQQMSQNNRVLLEKRKKVNDLATNYSLKNDDIAVKIDSITGASYFGYSGSGEDEDYGSEEDEEEYADDEEEDASEEDEEEYAASDEEEEEYADSEEEEESDTGTPKIVETVEVDSAQLEELKNMSLKVYSAINRIVLLVNKDLLLEDQLQRFDEHYKTAMDNFGQQEEALRFTAENVKGENVDFSDLGALVGVTYQGIQTVIPELRSLYLDNKKKSKQLQDTEKKISTISLKISKLSEDLRRENHEIASKFQLIGQALIMLVLVVLGVMIGRSITQPLALLTTRTEEVDPDNLSSLKDKGTEEEQKLLLRKGELGVLARSFKKMQQAIVEKIELIEEYNRDLEQKVQERTKELIQKTKDIENMLENLPEGLFTILEDQTIHPEYSKFLEDIFETEDIAGQNLMDLVFTHTNLNTDSLDQVKNAVGVMIGEDSLMVEMNQHLLPTEVQKTFSDGRLKTLEIDWNPIAGEDDTVEKLLVTVRDVTELRKLQQKAGEQQRELEIIGQILSVKEGKFSDFIHSSRNMLKENEKLIKNSTQKDIKVLDALFRNMHTIKGNARTYGFMHLTQTVHDAEQLYDRLRKTALEWDAERLYDDLRDTDKLLEEYASINRKKLGRKELSADAGSVYMVESEKIEEIQRNLDSMDLKNPVALEKVLTSVQRDLSLIGTSPLKEILSGILDSLEPLAQELGKVTPEATINDNNILLKDEVSDILKNVFMHLYRNSMDHGLESEEERLAKGKTAGGQIQLTMRLEDGQLVFNFKDDGRGLNLKKVQEKAIANNLISVDKELSIQEVAALVFQSGLSTAEKATEVSGRGVGMDAIKKFIERSGGKIEILPIESEANTGDFLPFEVVFSLSGKYAVLVN